MYTAFHQHAANGSPVVRPLFWNDLADTLALNVSDEYFLGDHLLAAPVVDSLADARKLYLPRGRWYRIGTDSAYDGGQSVTVSAPEVMHARADSTALGGLPLFARAGAVIPMQAVMPYAGARPLDTLELHVWPTASSAVTSALYEDAGDGYAYEHGDYRATTITVGVLGANGALKISLASEGKYAGAKTYAVTLHAMHRPRLVRADSHTLQLLYDADSRLTTFAIPAATRTITITP
jgi:alpha-glucosidase (family GH31 glycosyl hydrolase)